ncbi:MAG: hypothetical protein ACE5PT_10820 [Gemmatimonadales bacterium]
MASLKGLTAAIGVGGALLLGSIAAAQQQGAEPRIDVDRLIAELGLPAEVKADLNNLNDFLARRAELRDQAIEIHNGLSEAFSGVLAKLTPEQRRELRIALRQRWAGQGMGWYMGGGMHGYGDWSHCLGYDAMPGMGWMQHGAGMGHRFRN